MVKRKSNFKIVIPRKKTMTTQRFVPTNVTRYLKSELKVTQVTSSVEFPTAGGVVLINGIATGTSINQRDALQIRLDNLDLYLSHQTTADYVKGDFRVFVVYDGAPNGVLPGFTDIFTNASVATAQRVDNMWRFKILYESTYGAGYGSGDKIGENYTKTWHKKLNLNNKSVQYIGTGSTIADIVKGALYLVVVGSTVNADLGYNLACRFRDK